MGSTRRTILTAGAAAAATAAVPRVFAQQAGAQGTGKFYEKGPVRIYYEEAGSGFPLLLLPGGGLNSTVAGLKGDNPFSSRPARLSATLRVTTWLTGSLARISSSREGGKRMGSRIGVGSGYP